MPAFAQFVRFISLLSLLILSNIGVAQETKKILKNESTKTLTLYNWPEYFDEKLITSFEAKYNVSIHQVFYETDELKDEYLISTNGGEGLDIIIGSDVSFKTYIKRNWLASIDNQKIPNLKNIEVRWRDTSPTLTPYSVPYLWGTVGIAYRKDKISFPVSSWLDLFRPKAELKNKIIMIDDSRDTLGLALKALGYSTNSTIPFELGSAEKLLKNQRPFVSRYSYINLSKKSSLVTGDTWMSMVYNGDGLALKAIDSNIEFIVPKEGTNLWVDH
ncbi:MAG: spermidine/putrescine ABC transporter substrate-binding protein, partial [Pseudomonadales bacterium]|nr:spermidine/putrescine ABC transporter substrate-binding protein [Pseudomonadales bacterium]